MPVMTLDPKTALIVIDLQKGIVALPAVHPIGDVIANASALATGFRKHGLPVVLVNVAGGAPGRNEQTHGVRDFPPDWADLIPELNIQLADYKVTKYTWGAFANTDLDALLKEVGVTQVVLAGVGDEHWRRIDGAGSLCARLQCDDRKRCRDRSQSGRT